MAINKNVTELIDEPGSTAIPEASNDTKGIASFDANDFVVAAGKVSALTQKGIPQYLGKIVGGTTSGSIDDLVWELDPGSINTDKPVCIGEYIMLTKKYGVFVPGDIFKITKVQVKDSAYDIRTDNVKAMSLGSLEGPKGEQGEQGEQGLIYLGYSKSITLDTMPYVNMAYNDLDTSNDFAAFTRTPVIDDLITVDAVGYNDLGYKASFMLTMRITYVSKTQVKAIITGVTDTSGIKGDPGDIGAIDIFVLSNTVRNVKYNNEDGASISGMSVLVHDGGYRQDVNGTMRLPLAGSNGINIDANYEATKLVISMDANLPATITMTGSLLVEINPDIVQQLHAAGVNATIDVKGTSTVRYHCVAVTDNEIKFANVNTEDNTIHLISYVTRTNQAPYADLKDLGIIGGVLNISEGDQSIAQQYVVDEIDYSAVATGDNAVALGGKRYDKLADVSKIRTTAKGNQSIAAGGSVIAHGDWNATFGKETETYQKASFAAGNKTKAGMTEEEFNTKWAGNSKDSDGNLLDHWGSTYQKSYSGATAVGVETKALGRGDFAFGNASIANGCGAIAGGYNAKVNSNNVYGVALGYNVTANGEGTVVIGKETTINGDTSYSIGGYNTLNGNTNFNIGDNNTIGTNGDLVNTWDNFVAGHHNTVTGSDNYVIGNNLTVNGGNKIVLGRCNWEYNDADNGYSIFELGDGKDAENKYNVVTITKPDQNAYGTATTYNALFRSNVTVNGKITSNGVPINDTDVVRKVDLGKAFTLTGSNGTLSSSVLSDLQSNDLNYIINDNEIFRLMDKCVDLGYIVYGHVGNLSNAQTVKTITITLSTRAWVLQSSTIGGGGTKLYRYIEAFNITGAGGSCPEYMEVIFTKSGSDINIIKLMLSCYDKNFSPNDISYLAPGVYNASSTFTTSAVISSLLFDNNIVEQDTCYVNIIAASTHTTIVLGLTNLSTIINDAEEL